MPITIPPPSGKTMTRSPSGPGRAPLGEVRPEDAEHADQRGGDAEVQQRPADRAIGPDVGEAFAQLGRRSSRRLLGLADRAGGLVGDGARRRRRRRQREAEAAATKYSAATTRITASRPAMLIDERPEQREPECERRVEGQREHAVRRQQLLARHDLRDHRRLGRGEEHGHRGHEDVQEQNQQEVVADEEQPDDREAAQDVGGTRTSRRSSRSTNTPGERREQDGRHEERQDQQADGRIRLVDRRR